MRPRASVPDGFAFAVYNERAAQRVIDRLWRSGCLDLVVTFRPARSFGLLSPIAVTPSTALGVSSPRTLVRNYGHSIHPNWTNVR